MTMIAPDFLDGLLAEEDRLLFPAFDNDAALSLGLKLLETARQRKLPVTIDVARAGQQLFHAALPGTTADNDQWIARKSAAVMRFGHSSYYLGRNAAFNGVPFAESKLVDPLLYAAHGGAFPIRVIGTGLVGTAAVSGLPQQDDHALVVEVIAAFLAEHYPKPG